MTWFEAIPVALVCVAWLLVPGLLVTYALGLRGVVAWGTAPLVVVATAATTAVVADQIGVAWSPVLLAAVSFGIALVLGVVSFILSRRGREVRITDPRPVTLAAALGMLPAIAIGIVTAVQGFGDPDNISQTYDAMFHYNAVAYVLDSQNGSSLTLAALGAQTTGPAFYPGGWHDLVSILIMSTGTGVPA
ncbi:MAG: hypothetical protein M3548_04250, partial [Actinomycetota bacterium]|nr:hypothetical protein [Actinomycetota bacterium]